MWSELAGIGVAASPLILGELTVRCLSLKQEVARKLVHVLGALASASLALFLSLHVVAVIGVLFCGVLLIVRRYKLVTALYDVKRRSYGELLFPLGVSAAALLAKVPDIYISAMLIVGLADTAASMAGIRYGRHHLPGARAKSLEGSLAFGVVSSVILLITFNRAYYSVGIGLVLAVVEAYSGRGLDNLTVPLVGAVILDVLA